MTASGDITIGSDGGVRSGGRRGGGAQVAPAMAARAGMSDWLVAWLPALLLAYAVIVSPLLFAVPESSRGLYQLAPVDTGSNLLNQLLFPLAFGAAVLPALFAARHRLRPLLHPALFLLLVFVAWAATSALWSADAATTIKRVIVQVCMLGALTLPVLLVRDPAMIVDRLFAVAALAAFLNLAVVLTVAAGPIGHEGIYAQKNTLGAIAAFCALFALHRVVAGRGIARLAGLAVLLAAIVILVASRSKTALGLALLAPPAALLLLAASRSLKISAAIMVTGGALTALIVYLVGADMQLWDFVALSQAVVGDPTFTSRTDIWDFALAMIERRPLLGFGYEAFWANGYESPAVREGPGFVARMPHAHNGYFDIALQTGLVGLAIFLLGLLAVLHASAARFLPPALGWLVTAIVLISVAYNLLETTWFQPYSAMWMLFVVSAALAARYRHA